MTLRSNEASGSGSNTGLTLFELIIALAIFVVSIGSLVVAQDGCLALAEGARNTTIGLNLAREKAEEIRAVAFGNVPAYDGQTFTLAAWGAPHRGVVRVVTTDPALLEIYISVSWRQRGNRVVGEDTNLNGVPDAGEDANGNGRLDSPASLVTLRSDL
ncbi:MAG: hypothetical protein HY597_02680 [Candidatus Omnitrophica bacterium]|nr:hypothetical protein [Candidatus Omnitrophota bacterium]